jgi:hypothetical protein
MTTADEIVAHLKGEYHPAALLLHGSRAIGKERVHSDWDIVMLFNSTPPREKYREQIGDADVEWKAYQLPISNEQIIPLFGMHLQFAKVLWEEGDSGSDLLRRAALQYEKGPQLSPETIQRELKFFEHKIAGMEDDKNIPHMFLRHLSIVYPRAIELWFQILHNEFSKPLYLAVPEIKERDPKYYGSLEILFSDSSNEQKVLASRELLTLLNATAG